MENGSQILDQVTEIDTAVRSEIEQDLGVVEGIFAVDQLHIELMLMDLLQADIQCLDLFFLVLRFVCDILFRSHPDHFLQRLDDLIIRFVVRRDDDLSELHAAGRLHDHFISLFHLQVSRRDPD